MTAFPYLSHTGFLGAAKACADHPFAVAGVCWDGSETNRPGAGGTADRRPPDGVAGGDHSITLPLLRAYRAPRKAWWCASA